MHEYRIGFNIDDTANSAEQVVSTLANIYRRPSAKAHVDLTSCRYLGPTASVMLVGLKELAIEAGGDIRFTPPAGPKKLKAYCSFSNLDWHLFGGAKEDPSHPASVTIPVKVFKTRNVAMLFPIFDLVERFVDMSDDAKTALDVCVFEAINNIIDHSESPIGGVIAARFLSRRGHVRVSILDHGIGIPASVAAEAGTDVHTRALQWAIEPGNTSKPGGNNLGLGLDNLVTIVSENGGDAFVYSGQACADVSSTGTRVRHAGADMQGTLITLHLPMSGEPQEETS